MALFNRLVSNSTVKNIHLINASVTGNDDVGLLVGESEDATIINCHVEGFVNGTNSNVGGLVGYLDELEDFR